MKIPLVCPHCKEDLRVELPQHQKEEYANQQYTTKAVGWIDRDQDRLTEWECPTCHKRWKRED